MSADSTGRRSEPAPHAGRPRGEAWRALQAEGILWEGQVLLLGGQRQLPARLVITGQRLAFARGGEVALDIARWWLKPPPHLNDDGQIVLSIETGAGRRDRFRFITRDGIEDAVDIIFLLTGHRPAAQGPALVPDYDDVPRPARPAQAEERQAEPEPEPEQKPQRERVERPVERETYRTSPQPVAPIPTDVWTTSETSEPSRQAAQHPDRDVARSERRWAASADEPHPSTARSTRETSPPVVPVAQVHADEAASLDTEDDAAPPVPASRPSMLDADDFPPVASIGSEGLPASGWQVEPTSAGAITISTLDSRTRQRAYVPAPTAPPAKPHRDHAGWAVRLTGLVLLIVAAAAFGASRLPESRTEFLPTFGDSTIAAPSSEGTDVAQLPPTVSPTPGGDETAEATGVGGLVSTATSTPSNPISTITPVPTETATSTPTETATATPEPTATSTPEPTETSTPDPTVTETQEPTATSEPTPRPTRTPRPTEEPTEEPTATEEPTEEPTATEEPEPTATATKEPEPTATSEPTETPAPEPTATDEPTATAMPEPTATPTATPTAEPTATPTNTAVPTETATNTAVPTELPTNTPVPPTATNTAIPPTATVTSEPPTVTATPEPPTATPEPTATATPEPTATETPTPVVVSLESTPTPESLGPPLPTEPSSEPSATATVETAPTETSTPEVPTETSTSVSTETPTTAPTETSTVAPTETPTPEPTEPPTATATETVEPTATETATPDATATETPEPTPTPGFPTQPRTVDREENPEQAFATGAFRYTIEAAVRGPELPTVELGLVPGFEWTVVVVHIRNWSDAPATLNMTDLQLLLVGPSFGSQFVTLDPVTGQIAQFLGFDPVLGATDVVTIEPGDTGRLALVYLIPVDTTNLELIDGFSGIDLGPSLAQGDDLTNLGRSPQAPDFQEATVIEVIDGRTIVVEADGFTATVQYLGVNAPTGGSCYSAGATLENTNLVLGATVYLERQYANRRSSGTLVRDVWIDNGAGGFVLASAVLASTGAVWPDEEPPNLRYAAWIDAASASAQFNLLGLWGICGGIPTEQLVQAPSALLPPQEDPLSSRS